MNFLFLFTLLQHAVSEILSVSWKTKYLRYCRIDEKVDFLLLREEHKLPVIMEQKLIKKQLRWFC